MPRAVRHQDVEEARLTVDDYFRMIDSGEIDADARVELWEGRIVDKMGKNQPHEIALMELLEQLFRIVPASWHVSSQSPVILGDDKAPEPDLMVVRGARRDYLKHPPSAKNVPLVIEVAESSLRRDLGLKKSAYAAEGIPFYWVVNLAAHRVEVHSRPKNQGKHATYENLKIYEAGEAVPLILDGVEVGRVIVSIDLDVS
jgi:Uma2 family endonuclease